VGIGRKYSISEGKWKYPISMLRARRLIKSLKPDIVHTHYATSGGLSGLVCGFHPTIVTVHGSDLTIGINSRIWRPLLKRIFEYTDCVNTVSEDLRDMVLSLDINPEKIETLTLGIDIDRFSFVELPAINQAGVLRLVCTRNMEPAYDNQTIVKALVLLKEKDIKFKMTFVGDGSLSGQLKHHVKDTGLDESVSFVGRVDNCRLPSILQEHDIYLSASLHDGTSLSLLEAMATGLFPVVSDIKANSTWLRHDIDGLLHKVGDAGDLANCIARVVSEPEMVAKAVRHNRQSVVARGNRKENMKRLGSIYERLVRKIQQ
jgi:glycosyltransferase involved in cell wall biosynthesis